MPKRGGKSRGELGRAMVRDKDRKRRAAPTTHDKINVRPCTHRVLEMMDILIIIVIKFSIWFSFASSLFILPHL
jgi:hypothetical protein